MVRQISVNAYTAVIFLRTWIAAHFMKGYVWVKVHDQFTEGHRMSIHTGQTRYTEPGKHDSSFALLPIYPLNTHVISLVTDIHFYATKTFRSLFFFIIRASI